MNVVTNYHKDPLYMKWPAAFIFHTYQPIPSGEQDVVTYTVSSAGSDKSAMLTYGLAAIQQKAPAYIDPDKTEIPDVLTSETRISTTRGLYRLQVVSTYVRAHRLLVYSIVRNRNCEIVFGATEPTVAAFVEGGWSVGDRIESIEGAESVAKGTKWPEARVPDFRRFRVYESTNLRAAASVRLPVGKQLIVQPSLVMISDNRRLVGTGVISLHTWKAGGGRP